MDILEKFKLRIEFEKKQSCFLYKEGKLNDNLLRTYTIDTISHLIVTYNEDYEFVKTLKEIRSDLDRSTRIICLDVPQDVQESDTVVDFIIDENTLISNDDIYDTCSEFELIEDTLPGIEQIDYDRLVADKINRVFCHIGYKIDDSEVLCKSENQDFIASSNKQLIVCDGVGSGINSKDISEFVGIQFSNFIESFYANLKIINEFSRSAFIQQGVYVLNQQLTSLMKSQQFNDSNSGTTLSGAIKIGPNAFHICSIGDSPIYTFDIFKGFSQINTDDTLLKKLYKKGFFANSPSENDLTISLLRSMWPNNSDENLYSMARQCIVKSFGFKMDGVTFSEGNNQTIHLESSSGIIICSDGISDQFNIETFHLILLLGGIKEMIREFNLERYADCFNYSSAFMKQILSSCILDFNIRTHIKVIYNTILAKVFSTYGFHVNDVILTGGIKEVSNEALLVMQNQRLNHLHQPLNGFKKPKSDNIAIGYLV